MQVLYPLFVYAYLDIVRKGHSARAREMMRKLKARFVEADGASVSVANELEDLTTVVFPQHLQNPVPKQVRDFCEHSDSSCCLETLHEDLKHGCADYKYIYKQSVPLVEGVAVTAQSIQNER